MLHVARLIFYPHQLPPTLRARRLTPSACEFYDLTIFWFLEARKPIMNDSSSRWPLNARIRGALSLASFLGTGVASPSVRLPSIYISCPFSHFSISTLLTFQERTRRPYFWLDPSAVVNTVTSKVVLFIQDLFTCKFFFPFSLHFYFAWTISY